MAKIDILNGQAYYYCPGCKEPHAVSIDPERARVMRDGSKPCWTFNGNVDAPTLSPSVNYPNHCHHFVRDGQIQFLGDCTHALAGQTVELPDWNGWGEPPAA